MNSIRYSITRVLLVVGIMMQSYITQTMEETQTKINKFNSGTYGAGVGLEKAEINKIKKNRDFEGTEDIFNQNNKDKKKNDSWLNTMSPTYWKNKGVDVAEGLFLKTMYAVDYITGGAFVDEKTIPKPTPKFLMGAVALIFADHVIREHGVDAVSSIVGSSVRFYTGLETKDKVQLPALALGFGGSALAVLKSNWQFGLQMSAIVNNTRMIAALKQQINTVVTLIQEVKTVGQDNGKKIADLQKSLNDLAENVKEFTENFKTDVQEIVDESNKKKAEEIVKQLQEQLQELKNDISPQISQLSDAVGEIKKNSLTKEEKNKIFNGMDTLESFTKKFGHLSVKVDQIDKDVQDGFEKINARFDGWQSEQKERDAEVQKAVDEVMKELKTREEKEEEILNFVKKISQRDEDRRQEKENKVRAQLNSRKNNLEKLIQDHNAFVQKMFVTKENEKDEAPDVDGTIDYCFECWEELDLNKQQEMLVECEQELQQAKDKVRNILFIDLKDTVGDLQKNLKQDVIEVLEKAELLDLKQFINATKDQIRKEIKQVENKVDDLDKKQEEYQRHNEEEIKKIIEQNQELTKLIQQMKSHQEQMAKELEETKKQNLEINEKLDRIEQGGASAANELNNSVKNMFAFMVDMKKDLQQNNIVKKGQSVVQCITNGDDNGADRLSTTNNRNSVNIDSFKKITGDVIHLWNILNNHSTSNLNS